MPLKLVCVLHTYPLRHSVSLNIMDTLNQSAFLPLVFIVIRTEEITPLKSLCWAPISCKTPYYAIYDYSNVGSEDFQLWWAKRGQAQTQYIKEIVSWRHIHAAVLGGYRIGEGGREIQVNQELLSGEDCPGPDWRLTLINQYSILVFNKCSVQKVFCNI